MDIDIVFEDHGNRTTLRSTTTFASLDDLQKVLDMGMIEGLSETLDRLDELFARTPV